METISSTEMLNYVFKKLEKNNIAVLATCGNDGRVTARAMSFIHDDKDLFFQTDRRFLKSKQLKDNPNCALSFDNIQIEGSVEDRGHSSLEQNQWFCETYKKIHPGSFKMYTMLPDQVIYRIIPRLITFWKYKDGKAFREILDCETMKAERSIYWEQLED